MLHERVLERARTATRLSRAPPSEKSAPKQTLRSERATHESLAPVNCADVSPIFSKRTPPSPFASRAVSEETNQTAVEDVPCEDALAQGTCESDKRLEDGGKDCLHGGKRRMTNIKAEAEATFLSRNAWSDERHGTICDGDDEGEWSLCVVLPDSVRPVYRFALTVVSKSSGITRWYTEMCLAHGYLSYAGASKHARHIVVERYSAHDDDRATPPPTDTVSTPLTVADDTVPNASACALFGSDYAYVEARYVVGLQTLELLVQDDKAILPSDGTTSRKWRMYRKHGLATDDAAFGLEEELWTLYRHATSHSSLASEPLSPPPSQPHIDAKEATASGAEESKYGPADGPTSSLVVPPYKLEEVQPWRYEDWTLVRGRSRTAPHSVQVVFTEVSGITGDCAGCAPERVRQAYPDWWCVRPRVPSHTGVADVESGVQPETEEDVAAMLRAEPQTEETYPSTAREVDGEWTRRAGVSASDEDDCSGLVYYERHHKSSASRVRDGLAEDEADNLDGNYAGMRARSECSICETRSATFCERRLLIVPPASSGAYTDGDTKRQGVVEYAVAYDDAQNGGYRSQKTRVTHLASGMNVVERTRTRMWDPTGGRDDADLDVCRKLVRLCSGQLVLDAVIRNRDFVSYHNRLDVLNDMPATREPHIPKLHYSDPRQVAALVRNDPGRDDPHIFLCPSYVKFALRDLAVFSKALPMLLPPLPPQPPCLAPLASDGAVTGGPQDLESGRSGARENKRDDRHDVACDGALHEGWTGYDTRVAFGRIYDVDARGRVRERVAEGARGGDRYYDTLRIWAAVVSELGPCLHANVLGALEVYEKRRDELYRATYQRCSYGKVSALLGPTTAEWTALFERAHTPRSLHVRTLRTETRLRGANGGERADKERVQALAAILGPSSRLTYERRAVSSRSVSASKPNTNLAATDAKTLVVTNPDVNIETGTRQVHTDVLAEVGVGVGENEIRRDATSVWWNRTLAVRCVTERTRREEERTFSDVGRELEREILHALRIECDRHDRACYGWAARPRTPFVSRDTTALGRSQSGRRRRGASARVSVDGWSGFTALGLHRSFGYGRHEVQDAAEELWRLYAVPHQYEYFQPADRPHVPHSEYRWPDQAIETGMNWHTLGPAFACRDPACRPFCEHDVRSARHDMYSAESKYASVPEDDPESLTPLAPHITNALLPRAALQRSILVPEKVKRIRMLPEPSAPPRFARGAEEWVFKKWNRQWNVVRDVAALALFAVSFAHFSVALRLWSLLYLYAVIARAFRTDGVKVTVAGAASLLPESHLHRIAASTAGAAVVGWWHTCVAAVSRLWDCALRLNVRVQHLEPLACALAYETLAVVPRLNWVVCGLVYGGMSCVNMETRSTLSTTLARVAGWDVSMPWMVIFFAAAAQELALPWWLCYAAVMAVTACWCAFDKEVAGDAYEKSHGAPTPFKRTDRAVVTEEYAIPKLQDATCPNAPYVVIPRRLTACRIPTARSSALTTTIISTKNMPYTYRKVERTGNSDNTGAGTGVATACEAAAAHQSCARLVSALECVRGCTAFHTERVAAWMKAATLLTKHACHLPANPATKTRHGHRRRRRFDVTRTHVYVNETLLDAVRQELATGPGDSRVTGVMQTTIRLALAEPQQSAQRAERKLDVLLADASLGRVRTPCTSGDDISATEPGAGAFMLTDARERDTGWFDTGAARQQLFSVSSKTSVPPHSCHIVTPAYPVAGRRERVVTVYRSDTLPVYRSATLSVATAEGASSDVDAFDTDACSPLTHGAPLSVRLEHLAATYSNASLSSGPPSTSSPSTSTSSLSGDGTTRQTCVSTTVERTDTSGRPRDGARTDEDGKLQLKMDWRLSAQSTLPNRVLKLVQDANRNACVLEARVLAEPPVDSASHVSSLSSLSSSPPPSHGLIMTARSPMRLASTSLSRRSHCYPQRNLLRRTVQTSSFASPAKSSLGVANSVTADTASSSVRSDASVTSRSPNPIEAYGALSRSSVAISSASSSSSSSASSPSSAIPRMLLSSSVLSMPTAAPNTPSMFSELPQRVFVPDGIALCSSRQRSAPKRIVAVGVPRRPQAHGHYSSSGRGWTDRPAAFRRTFCAISTGVGYGSCRAPDGGGV